MERSRRRRQSIQAMLALPANILIWEHEYSPPFLVVIITPFTINVEIKRNVANYKKLIKSLLAESCVKGRGFQSYNLLHAIEYIALSTAWKETIS